ALIECPDVARVGVLQSTPEQAVSPKGVKGRYSGPKTREGGKGRGEDVRDVALDQSTILKTAARSEETWTRDATASRVGGNRSRSSRPRQLTHTPGGTLDTLISMLDPARFME